MKTRRLAILFCGVALAACGAPADTGSIEASATQTGTAFAIPDRPSDLPTDGTCEEDRRCFGILQPGSFQTEFLDPNFTFEISEPGWVNLQSSGGMLNLFPVDTPGDEMVFLQRVTAREPDGGRAAGVGATAAELAAWLSGRPDLLAEEIGPISIGGLDGVALDLSVPAEASPVLDDCPTEQCVLLVGGVDPAEMPSWTWDIALWRGAAMRIWLLDAPDQVVAFEATAWDGSEVEALLERVQPILDSVEFIEEAA